MIAAALPQLAVWFRLMSKNVIRSVSMAALAALMTAAPAAAQWFEAPVPRFEAPMPPHAIALALEDRGFELITRPRLRGRVYVVEALNRRGARVRLVVEPYEGDIIERIRLEGPDERFERPYDVEPRGPALLEHGPRYNVPRGFDERDDGDRYDGAPRRADRRDPGEWAFEESRPLPPQGAQRPKQRNAARTEPPAVKKSVPPTGDRPTERKLPGPSTVPPAPAPSVEAPKLRDPAPEPPAVTAAAPERRNPVRVIEGVTPVFPPAEAKPDDNLGVPVPDTLPAVRID